MAPRFGRALCALCEISALCAVLAACGAPERYDLVWPEDVRDAPGLILGVSTPGRIQFHAIADIEAAPFTLELPSGETDGLILEVAALSVPLDSIGLSPGRISSSASSRAQPIAPLVESVRSTSLTEGEVAPWRSAEISSAFSELSVAGPCPDLELRPVAQVAGGLLTSLGPNRAALLGAERTTWFEEEASGWTETATRSEAWPGQIHQATPDPSGGFWVSVQGVGPPHSVWRMDAAGDKWLAFELDYFAGALYVLDDGELLTATLSAKFGLWDGSTHRILADKPSDGRQARVALLLPDDDGTVVATTSDYEEIFRYRNGQIVDDRWIDPPPRGPTGGGRVAAYGGLVIAAKDGTLHSQTSPGTWSRLDVPRFEEEAFEVVAELGRGLFLADTDQPNMYYVSPATGRCPRQTTPWDVEGPLRLDGITNGESVLVAGAATDGQQTLWEVRLVSD